MTETISVFRMMDELGMHVPNPNFDLSCNLGELETIHRLIDAPTGVIIRNEELHAQAMGILGYREIGMGVASMLSMFPQKEVVSPKEQKKRYKAGLHTMVNKGKKW